MQPVDSDFEICSAPHIFIPLFGIAIREKWFKTKRPNLHAKFHIVTMKRPPFAKEQITIGVQRTLHEKTFSYFYVCEDCNYLLLGPAVTNVTVLCYRSHDGVIHFGFAINQTEKYHSIRTWSFANSSEPMTPKTRTS